MDIGDAKETDLRVRFGKHVSSSIIAAISIKLIALVLVKVLSSVLPKVAFGIYSLWLAYVFLVSTTSTSAFSTSLWRFLQARRLSNKERAAGTLIATCLSGSFTLMVVVNLIVLGLYRAIGFQIVDDLTYISSFAIVVVLTSFFVLKEIVLVVSGTEQNSKEILSFNLLFGLSSSLFAILVTILHKDFQLTMIALSIGYSFPVIGALIVKLKRYGMEKPNLQVFKEVMFFGGSMIIATLSTNVTQFIVSFGLQYWIGLAEVATLAIAFTLASILSFVVGPALNAYQAYIVNAYELGHSHRGDQVTSRIMEFFIIFMIPIAWLMVTFSPLLIEIISTSDYLDAVIVLPYIVVSAVLVSFSYFWKLRLDLAKRTSYIGLAHLSSLVILVSTAILLIPYFGLVGTGVSIVAQSLVLLSFMMYSGNRFLPINTSRRFIGAMFLAMILLVISGVILSHMGQSMLIIGLVPVLFYLIPFLAGKLLGIQEIRQIIRLLLGQSNI